jgi:hypothetical protein
MQYWLILLYERHINAGHMSKVFIGLGFHNGKSAQLSRQRLIVIVRVVGYVTTF